MDVLTKGSPDLLDNLQNGECFSFESGDRIAIGIKIAYREAPNSRVLILARDPGRPPTLQSRREAVPTIVYKQPALAVATGTTPSRLRNGVGNPQLGHIMQFEQDVYVGFADEHEDPSSVSLKTGLINPNPISGPAAVFENWQIVLQGGIIPETVYVYAPAVP